MLMSLNCHLYYAGDFVTVEPQVPHAQNMWCMRQLVYTQSENCMGKSPIIKII